MASGINQWDNNNKDIAFRGIISPWEGINVGGSVRYRKQQALQIQRMAMVSRTTIGGELAVDYFNFLLHAEYLYGYGENLKGTEGGGCGGGGIPDIEGELERNGWYAMLLIQDPMEPGTCC